MNTAVEASRGSSLKDSFRWLCWAGEYLCWIMAGWTRLRNGATALLLHRSKSIVYDLETGVSRPMSMAALADNACGKGQALYERVLLVHKPSRTPATTHGPEKRPAVGKGSPGLQTVRFLSRHMAYCSMDESSLEKLADLGHACVPMCRRPHALMAQVNLSEGFDKYVDVTTVVNEYWVSFDTSGSHCIGGDAYRVTAAQLILVLAARGILTWRLAAATLCRTDVPILRILTSNLDEHEFRSCDVLLI